MSKLLGAAYSVNQMSYDLARLRLNGLIQRRPHSNTYILTTEGVNVAVFHTKVHNRVLRPLTAANRAPAPPEREALATINRDVNSYVTDVRIPKAA